MSIPAREASWSWSFLGWKPGEPRKDLCTIMLTPQGGSLELPVRSQGPCLPGDKSVSQRGDMASQDHAVLGLNSLLDLRLTERSNSHSSPPLSSYPFLSFCRNSPPAWLGHPGLFHPGHQPWLCGRLGLPHALERADLEGMHCLVKAWTAAPSSRQGQSWTWEEGGPN